MKKKILIFNPSNFQHKIEKTKNVNFYKVSVTLP